MFLNSFLNLSEMETVHQIERMQAYPPQLYRLANILEKRPESIFFYKSKNSFFNFLDTSKYSRNPNNILIFLFFVVVFIFYQKFRAKKKS